MENTYQNETLESLTKRYNDLFERLEVIRTNAPHGEDLQRNARYQRLSRELAKLALVVHRARIQSSPPVKAR